MVGIKSLKVHSVHSNDLQSDEFDDIIVWTEKNEIHLIDISASVNSAWPLAEDCSAMRDHSTENWGNTNQPLTIAITCENSFRVMNTDSKTLLETTAVNYHNNGHLTHFFKSESNPATFILQF